MRTLILIELEKIFSKWRTYIGFLAIGVLVPVVQIALYFEGENSINHFLRGIRDTFILSGSLFNGYLVANLVLQSLYIHIPFLIVLVGGDLMAGEGTAGTYRVILTRPVSRFRLLTAKYSAGLIYSGILLFFLALMSLGLSVLLFGTGELISIKDKLYIFAADDILWRFIGAYLFGLLSMGVALGLSFLFSTFVENAIGPIVGAMAVIIIFFILSALPIDILVDIKGFFFTTHMVQWSSFFTKPVETGELIFSGAVLFFHLILFYGVSLYAFIRKDILS